MCRCELPAELLFGVRLIGGVEVQRLMCVVGAIWDHENMRAKEESTTLRLCIYNTPPARAPNHIHWSFTDPDKRARLMTKYTGAATGRQRWMAGANRAGANDDCSDCCVCVIGVGAADWRVNVCNHMLSSMVKARHGDEGRMCQG
jgi:hypothetical protein